MAKQKFAVSVAEDMVIHKEMPAGDPVSPALIAAIASLPLNEAGEQTIEECGGFILECEGKFEFVRVLNDMAGTPRAPGLYEANKAEFGKKVALRTKEGWKPVASIHTHPQFSALPSTLDLTELFQNFKVNYIYSTKEQKIIGYRWRAEPTEDAEQQCDVFKVIELAPQPAETLA